MDSSHSTGGSQGDRDDPPLRLLGGDQQARDAELCREPPAGAQPVDNLGRHRQVEEVHRFEERVQDPGPIVRGGWADEVPLLRHSAAFAPRRVASLCMSARGSPHASHRAATALGQGEVDHSSACNLDERTR
ncbi:hypothetical protein [Streptomyces sp. NPDC002088]|uniref:hypothetical protein n=1 Tax=Streptomyces sp. NPDC002088 TaxID=3154665 RepID=UPI00331F200D